MMTSTQIHPLFAAFAAAGNANMLAGGNASPATSSAMSSGGLTISAAPTSGNNHHQQASSSNSLVSPSHSPLGLGGLGSSGLSVTITPTHHSHSHSHGHSSGSAPHSASSSPASNCNSNASAANAVAALALALSNGGNNHGQNHDHDMSSPPQSPMQSPCPSPPMSPIPSDSEMNEMDKDVKPFRSHMSMQNEAREGKNGKAMTSGPLSLPMSLPMAMSLSASGQLSSGANNMALAAQQQQLRALAANLQSAIAAAQQQNNANIMGKMMELANANNANQNQGMDDMTSELTQRLIKMNQEIWQQGLASVAAAASSQQQQGLSSPPPPPPSRTEGRPGSSSSAAGSGPSGSGAGHGVPAASPNPPGPSPGPFGAPNNASAAAAMAALSALTAGHQQANDIKLAEKLVNELAVQQSTRNAFHLNERTLQECWTTLQRISCMIFMHKSAMQLQQQQAVAAQQVQGGHHLGPHGSMMRAGSSSGSESGAGISKPHQCHQCLKSFSSNHQLVQHIRVHTGEKPYKCSYCDRRFKQLSHVQQHTRLHTGERPYKCHIPECGRAFIQLSNLQQHLRNHDAQLERSKNRPFHCNICGKGFATESSLRTHTSKVCKEQHGALIGPSNALSCPVCHKLFYGGEVLMEHMKYTHKDPNASGVATKRRTANHPCPICGKHYVNEGSLRKHLSCHPETAQLSSSLRMWPCSVCQAVFTHENGLLTHMEQMRTDPKHQFAAQYMLSRAAAERRERENILAAAAISAMTGHPFGGNQGQGLQHGSLGPLLPMPPSPSGSESSGRLSSPLDTNSGMSHSGLAQHSRLSMSSPVGGNGPLELTRGQSNGSNNNNAESRIKDYSSSGMPGSHNSSGGENNLGGREDQSHSHHHPSHLSHQGHHPLGSGHHNILSGDNGILQPNNKQLQDAMKMAAMLGQGGHNGLQNDVRHLIHQQDMMTAENMRMHTENLLRSQAEALRIAVENHNSNNNNNSKGSSGSSGTSPVGGGSNNGPNSEGLGGHMNSMISQHQHNQSGLHSSSGMVNGHRMMDHRMDVGGQGNNLSHSGHHHLHHPHASLNHHSHHQLNSLLSQQPDLSEALMRLDARSLGFPLPAHNS